MIEAGREVEHAPDRRLPRDRLVARRAVGRGRRGRRGLRLPAGPQRPARDRARPGRPRSRLARRARAGGGRPGGRRSTARGVGVARPRPARADASSSPSPRAEAARLRPGSRSPSLAWAQTQPQPSASPCRFTVTDAACVKELHCAFAPAADGSPTFVSGGELFAGRPGGRAELLVSAADLERILGRPAALEEVAWVDDERFWAVVRSGETARSWPLMTTDGLVGSPWFGAPIESPPARERERHGRRRSDQGVVFFDSGGGRALTFTNGRDVTWAPGGVDRRRVDAE